MIHRVPANAVIHPKDLDLEVFIDLIKRIKTKASLSRILDHGDAAPTCCGFYACIAGVHIAFGEYYVPNEVISVHRQNITDISIELVGETNLDNFLDYADPAIFKKAQQKAGVRWTTAQEYSDTEEIDAPPFFWSPADNNEFATRNRINELFRPSLKFKHPLTGATPALGLYFLMSDTQLWPHGIHNILLETKKQRKEFLGEVNGKKYYSDDRQEGVPDHGYDTLRYYVASHGVGVAEPAKQAPRNSFAHYNRIWKLRKMQLEGSLAGN